MLIFFERLIVENAVIFVHKYLENLKKRIANIGSDIDTVAEYHENLANKKIRELKEKRTKLCDLLYNLSESK